jgi:hypothetical protein
MEVKEYEGPLSPPTGDAGRLHPRRLAPADALEELLALVAIDVAVQHL